MSAQEKPAKPPRKQRIIALASWAGLIGGIRYGFGALMPSQIFGSLGALALGFAVFYLVLNYTSFGRKYKDRFYAVMRYWYKSRGMSVFFYVMFALNIAVLSGVEYGHHIFTSDQLNDKNLVLEGRPVDQLFGYVAAGIDNAQHGAFRWTMWLLFYEDIELIIFMLLVRWGLLFHD